MMSKRKPTNRPPRKFETHGATTRWSWHLGPDFPLNSTGIDAEAPSEESLKAAEARLVNYDPIPEWAPRAGRRTLRAKLQAGLVGFKHAVRGDSSFFAHAYRALLVVLTGSMLGLPPVSWCLLVFGFALVLIAELAHSAIDTLARAIGDPEEPRLNSTRDMAASIVLVAVTGSAIVSAVVLGVRFVQVLEG